MIAIARLRPPPVPSLPSGATGTGMLTGDSFNGQAEAKIIHLTGRIPAAFTDLNELTAARKPPGAGGCQP
jgi:hypothetical protein